MRAFRGVAGMAFAGIAFVGDQGGAIELGVRSALGQCRQRVWSDLGRLETWGL